MDPLIIHETGHEWFGNSVTASDPTHIWLHEGYRFIQKQYTLKINLIATKLVFIT